MLAVSAWTAVRGGFHPLEVGLHPEVSDHLPVLPPEGAYCLPAAVVVQHIPSHNIREQSNIIHIQHTRWSRWTRPERRRSPPPPGTRLPPHPVQCGDDITLGMRVLQTRPVRRSSISIPPVAGAYRPYLNPTQCKQWNIYRTVPAVFGAGPVPARDALDGDTSEASLCNAQCFTVLIQSKAHWPPLLRGFTTASSAFRYFCCMISSRLPLSTSMSATTVGLSGSATTFRTSLNPAYFIGICDKMVSFFNKQISFLLCWRGRRSWQCERKYGSCPSPSRNRRGCSRRRLTRSA